MGLLTCFEIMDRRHGGVDSNRHRTYERAFRCEFSDAVSTGTIACEVAVFNNYGIERFSPYREGNGFYDLAALAESIDSLPEDPENCFSWITVVKYSSQLWDDYLKALQSGGTGQSGSKPQSPHNQQSDSKSPENPLNRPANIRITVGRGKRALEYDYSGPLDAVTKRPTGVPVNNSAGDKFDPPVEVDEPWMVFVVTRNEADLTLMYPIDADGYVKQWTETQNDRLFKIASFTFFTGCVHLYDTQANSAFEDPWSYWQMSYEFHVRYPRRNGLIVNTAAGDRFIRGWDIDLLDQGRRELVAAGAWMQQNYDQYGTPAASDVPLNGSGRALTVAQIQAASFQYRAFRRFMPDNYDLLLMPHV